MNKVLTAVTMFLGLAIPGLAQNKLVGEAPFKMHGAHIILSGSVNGSAEFDFAFDTGAMGVFMDQGKAEEIGLKVTGKMPVMGASGERKTVETSTGNTININGVEFKNTTLVLRDDSGSIKSGRIHHCVLGYPQLSQYVTEFDYDNWVIRFYEPEGYRYKGNGKGVDIDLGMRIPMMEVAFILSDNTRVEGKTIVDTGASMAASLNTPVTKQYQLIEKADRFASKIGRGGTGSFVIKESRINGVSLAGYQFDNVPTGLSTLEKGPTASNMFIGLVGNYILNRFNITFDYANSKMYLEPNRKFNDDFRVNCSGLQYAHYPTGRGGFVVELVDEGSPAANIGIQKGDQLIKIGGKPVTEYAYNELIDLLSTDGKKLSMEWLSKSDGKLKKAKMTLAKLI